MLVMTRAAGESVLIGEDLLTVAQVSPSVRLQIKEGGRARSHRFHGGTYRTNRLMMVGSCRVVLMAVRRKEVTLGFDAPESTRIVRTELLPQDDTSKGTPDQR